jgi:hypothetical protein
MMQAPCGLESEGWATRLIECPNRIFPVCLGRKVLASDRTSSCRERRVLWKSKGSKARRIRFVAI